MYSFLQKVFMIADFACGVNICNVNVADMKFSMA